MKLKITKSTFKTLVDISITIAQVFFGAGVGAFALLPLDLAQLLVVVCYLLLSLGFWLLAIFFAEEGKI